MKKKEKKAVESSKKWWLNSPVGWSEVSEATYKRWHQYDRSKTKLDDDVAMSAMAFGYGSRTAYGEHRTWKDLVEQLELDWAQAGREDEHPWKQVHKAVKAGWNAAQAVAAPEPSKSLPAALAKPAPQEGPEANRVPGGRPDAHHVAPASTEADHDGSDIQESGGRPDHPNS